MPISGDGRMRDACLFSDPLHVEDAGEGVATALSERLGRDVRLVRTRKETERPYGGAAYGGFGDVAPLLIVNQASLDALNARLAWPVEMSRFRPNVVVAGAEAFAEDGWAELSIGTQVFEVIEPCVRCVLTTIDPETGRRDHGQQPLRSLSEFRADDGGGIHFGVYARPVSTGEIAQGDGVKARSHPEPRHYAVGKPGIALPDDRHLLRIVETEGAADQARHIWLRFEDRTWGAPIQPGQFITLRVPQPDGSEAIRSFTISARRHEDRELRVSVRQQGHGGVSDFLVNEACVGDTLWTSGIHGDFTFDTREQAALFLSAGSGVTPFLAMLSGREDMRDTVHIHVDRNQARAIGYEELQAAQKAQAGYKLSLRWSAQDGRLGIPQLAAIPGVAERKVWLCGPEGFVEQTRALLTQLNVPDAHVHTETFSRPETGAETGQTFMVSLDGAAPVAVDGGIPLLRALRAAGITLPSSCEVGSCGTCRLRLVEGECHSAGTTDDKTAILPCTSFARSDLVLARFEE
ncbi:MOSC domain-containing protein [Rhodobacteraceae bacterium D3-12]|nr:MOSC domain-containing protein [Rhodobacteraceae bacterium D3-12]